MRFSAGWKNPGSLPPGSTPPTRITPISAPQRLATVRPGETTSRFMTRDVPVRSSRRIAGRGWLPAAPARSRFPTVTPPDPFSPESPARRRLTMDNGDSSRRRRGDLRPGSQSRPEWRSANSPESVTGVLSPGTNLDRRDVSALLSPIPSRAPPEPGSRDLSLSHDALHLATLPRDVRPAANRTARLVTISEVALDEQRTLVGETSPGRK
jgi:hypothetical protein